MKWFKSKTKKPAELLEPKGYTVRWHLPHVICNAFHYRAFDTHTEAKSFEVELKEAAGLLGVVATVEILCN